MIIYTNKALFKPVLIILNFLFIPTIISLIVALVLLKEIFIAILLACFITIYIVTILLFKWESNRKTNFIKVEKDGLEINYPNLAKDGNCLSLNYEEIIKIDYYKITSFVSWLALVQMQLPKALFITFNKNGNIVRKAIGHSELSEVTKLCNENNIKYRIH